MNTRIRTINVNGYKNLINCKLDLDDFNILVGPNNSGKSNLFELYDFLYFLCFGDEEVRSKIMRGADYGRFSSTICHIPSVRDNILSLGFVFETNYKKNIWEVIYELDLRFGDPDKENTGFVKEIIQAKKITKPIKPGSPKTYIKREIKNSKHILKIKEKGKNRLREHKIERMNSSLLAIKSLYPEFEGLPDELNVFINIIKYIGLSSVCGVSPVNLRNKLHQGEEYTFRKGFGYDLDLVIDELRNDEPEKYEIFKEQFCDILDFDDITIWSKKIDLEGKGEQQIIRRLFVHKNNTRNMIDEFSDGTFAVAGILLALLSDNVGTIVLIEEPENFLHPRALNKLLRFIQEYAHQRQVLISTHSPYLLNGVNPMAVHVAVVDGTTGATHFENISDSKELRNYLKTGLMGFGELLASNFEEVLGTK